MSGPIVRKYGFPNFEQIFGKREPQHGVDDTDAAKTSPTEESKTESRPQPLDKEKSQGDKA